MTSYDRNAIALAVGLSCLAGYVDASGFLATGGVFVSFMSGNSTRLSVALVNNRYQYAYLVFGVIFLFVVGVIVGTVVSRQAGDRRKTWVLMIVTILLFIAAICHTIGQTYASTAFMVLAMGAENAVFQRDGEVSIGLTYMTGTLVKLGQQIAAIMFGGSKDTWWPYALHWLGLVSGAILGAWAHGALLALTLWPAVLAALFFCACSAKLNIATSQRTGQN
ncbi:MAG: DUF1275 domain-containing protein [Chthonomonas sp.]|nr:DUF1275 domain-containing protein [Chthonomonas sp.]